MHASIYGEVKLRVPQLGPGEVELRVLHIWPCEVELCVPQLGHRDVELRVPQLRPCEVVLRVLRTPAPPTRPRASAFASGRTSPCACM